jgi:hypothetical protein
MSNINANIIIKAAIIEHFNYLQILISFPRLGLQLPNASLKQSNGIYNGRVKG